MKKIVQSLLLCSIVLVLSSAQGYSQSTMLYYWNFNSFTAVDSTTGIVNTMQGIAPDYSHITPNTAAIIYTTIPGASSTFFSYVDGYATIDTLDYDTVNLQQGDTAGIALRARNPSDSMQLLFYIPTVNYENAVLTFGTETSSTTSGMLNQIYAYSLDSGATWKTSGLSIPDTNLVVDDTVFTRVSIGFSGDSLTNNNSKLVFRITFVGNNTGNKGNNRFDNVTLDADTIIAPTSVKTVTANNNTTYTLYPNPVTDRINITSSSADAKTILISNAVGQTVYMGLESGKQLSVNTANLSAGNYFVTIRDNSTNGLQTIKFIKE